MKNKIDLKKIAEKIKGIEFLINNGIITPDFNKNEIHFNLVCWNGKTKNFKQNWCKNLYIYIGVKQGKSFDNKRELKFFDIENGTLVAVFFNNKTKLYN